MANGNDKKRNKKKIILFSAIGLVLIALAAIIFLGSQRETIITVQTEKVQRRTLTQLVTATGKIQPITQVKINAEVSGEIIELPVREGQVVRKGQLLVKIKPDAYQAQFDRSQAANKIDEANLLKAEADFNRAKGLYAKKLISDSDMDLARASYDGAKAGYAVSSASVKEARETLAKTTINSPMDGIVSQLISERAERVSGSTFAVGTQIMTVADLEHMEARVDVGENDVVLVHINDTARIDVDSYPGRKFIGTVSQIANTATSRGLGTQDEVTNFQVRIKVHPSPDVVFRPGMSMSADIETETRHGVLAVPIQSVTVRVAKKEMKPIEASEGEAKLDTGTKKKEKEEKIEEVVFLAKDGKVTTAGVKRGISDETYVEVTGDKLEGSDVVSGPFKAINRDLENGSKVKVETKLEKQTGASVDVKK